MRALHSNTGNLELKPGLEMPTDGKSTVKVRVHYASLNPTDLDILKGDLDLFFRLYRVKSPVRTGLEFSGTVVEGDARFGAGTKVFGYTHLLKGPKTHHCSGTEGRARSEGVTSSPALKNILSAPRERV